MFDFVHQLFDLSWTSLSVLGAVSIISLSPLGLFLVGRKKSEPKEAPIEKKKEHPRNEGIAFRRMVDEIPAKALEVEIHSGNLSIVGDEFSASKLYVRGRASVAPAACVYCLACDKETVLGEAVNVIEWIDSKEHIKIKEHCQLGNRISSEKGLEIGRGCSFKELYGTPITTYSAPAELRRLPPEKTIADHNLVMGSDHFIVPPGFEMKENLVCNQDLYIKRGAIIHKTIKCKKNIYLEDEVFVNGDIFTDKNIVIGARCTLFGNVFAKRRVSISQGCRIGKWGQIRTVVGLGSIRIAGNVKIYGSVKTEGRGQIE